MSVCMVTVHPGHIADFGYRITSSGFALHHCTLGGDVDVIPHEVSLYDDDGLRLDMLDGMTRYAVVHREGWVPKRIAGPFKVDVKHGPFTNVNGRTALICEHCGWVGKYRHSSALRFLVSDQQRHRCEVKR